MAKRKASYVEQSNGDGFKRLASFASSDGDFEIQRNRSAEDLLACEKAKAIRAEAAAVFAELLRKGSAPDDGAGKAEAGVDDDQGATLTQEIFRRGAQALGLDYFREAEVYRVWKRLHKGEKFPRDAQVTKDAFCQAALDQVSMHSIVVQVHARLRGRQFVVPDDFDYSKATAQNYCSSEKRAYGAFNEFRAGGKPPSKRDYNYHCHYNEARQAWQDEIVRLTVTRHNAQPRPWIVFTCGPMGCGKGYTFQKLSEWGYFPIENIVRIDPDFFKSLMPEWQGFVDHGMDAGTMTHRESTYIQELCQEAALRRQQNIWVDGSLRDVVWFKQVFEDIRRRHPVYRIGIIHVHASEPVVRARIAERARRTNRNVPERLILESLAAPARSLFELTSLCDWVARIDNEVSPTLTSFNQVDRSGHWSAMSSRWARTEPAPYEFPHRLAPVALQPIEELSLAEGEAFPPNGGVIKLVHREIGRGSGKELISELKVTPRRLIHLSMSVTSDIARKSLRIDEDSTLVAYVVPAGDADKTFQHGGALYFDRSEKLYAAVRIAGQCSTCHFRYFMHFNTPVNKTAEEVSAILRDEWRWGPVSLPEMRNGGAIRTTFVGREELPDVAGLGAYLFELRDGSFKLFTLRVPTS